MMDLIFIYLFSFLFLFLLFFILDLDKEYDITSHITVTQKSQSGHICHSHRLHNHIT